MSPEPAPTSSRPPFDPDREDVIRRAASCAGRCDAALERGDKRLALQHLAELLEAVRRIDEVYGDDPPELPMLRKQAARLWKALCSGVFPLAKNGS
jgi:hypothetical protein